LLRPQVQSAWVPAFRGSGEGWVEADMVVNGLSEGGSAP